MTEIHAGRYEIDADRETALRAEILDVLAEARAPMTLRQIAEAAAPVAEPGSMNISAGRIAVELSCLVSQRAVERICGTDGKPKFQLRRPALPANSATAVIATAGSTVPNQRRNRPPPQPSAATPATPATPATEKPSLPPLIALRSDGIIEIRRADAPVIELAQTDIAELWKFISGLRSALT